MSHGQETFSAMTRRIRRILLVCNSYDRFTLEEDGRLESQISNEYFDLNLSNPPKFIRAESTMDALELVAKGETFDLVLTMYNVGEVSVFDFSKKMKESAPDTPVVLLTSFSREVYKKISLSDTSCIDYVFCWNNSTDLIIAIVKLLEDKLNAEHDILKSGVQAILLVEDSVRYYSTYLPMLYKFVLQQNSDSIREALNEQQQILRKRSRPKILLATNYDEALELYGKYRNNILGVISDIGFVLHKGDSPELEKLDAGIDLCKYIRQDDPYMPIMMQSSQESMREVAESLGVGFVCKNSKLLFQELHEYMCREFGFGDFVALDPATGEEIARARDLRELEHIVLTIPDDSLIARISRNYLSRWLFARGIFQVGNAIVNWKMDDFPDMATHRKALADAIHDYRINQGLGVVAKFDCSTFNDAIWFSRLGDGSLGGKARGLAFINHVLQKHKLYDNWEDVRVMVPRTLVITTEYFDRFITDNGLKYVIEADLADEDILSEFVASTLHPDVVEALRIFLKYARKPLAIRSSSKLEDSYYQPFAGVYSTYMIPRTENPDQQLRLLTKAIKSVYASIYYSASKSYISATGNVISEEKMGIVIQEICGSEDQGYYFPAISGVARSVNFYPIGYEKPEEGIVKVAYGLGKAVVDGDQVLRFSPKYPRNVLQTSTPDLTMRETQQAMYALNLQPEKFKTSVDDAVNLEYIPATDCAKFRTFGRVVSTWDMENMRIVDSPYPNGPKFITFAHILKYNSFPLAGIVDKLLEISQAETKCYVEIEFAVDLDVEDGKSAIFNVLQIRPISADSMTTEVDWNDIDTEGAIITSSNALGTGWVNDVCDVVYLRPEHFDTIRTVQMAEEIRALNARMREQGRNYVLVGYGRWGSTIPSLGVPVKWSDISEAKAIVECCLDDFRVDPSQGTHFFQNLTSFNVGYLNVDPFARNDMFDVAQLDALDAEYESEFVRQVRFDKPLKICIDGRNNKAVIRKD